jgi:hypothetical protein
VAQKLQVCALPTIPDEFMLQIAQDNIRKCRVIWRRDDTLGAEFTDFVLSEDVQRDQPEAAPLAETIAKAIAR